MGDGARLHTERLRIGVTPFGFYEPAGLKAPRIRRHLARNAAESACAICGDPALYRVWHTPSRCHQGRCRLHVGATT